MKPPSTIAALAVLQGASHHCFASPAPPERPNTTVLIFADAIGAPLPTEPNPRYDPTAAAPRGGKGGKKTEQTDRPHP